MTRKGIKLEVRRIMIFSKDMEGMTRFYEELLGLTVVERTDDFVDLDAGSCRIALHRTKVTRPGRTKICFYVDDVSFVRAELVRRGVTMAGDPGPGPGLRLCDAEDPEGNVIQISNRP